MYDEIFDIDDITEDETIEHDTEEDNTDENDDFSDENDVENDDTSEEHDTEEEETTEDDITEDNEEKTEDTITDDEMLDKLSDMLAQKMGIKKQDVEQHKPTGMTEEMAVEILKRELQENPQMAYINYANNLSEAKLNGFKGQYGDVLNQQMLKKEIAKVSSRYQDFNDYEPDLKDIIQNDIDNRYKDNERLSDEAAYEMAYLIKKVEKLEAQAKTAFENGKKAKQQMKDTKKKISNPKRTAKQENNVSSELEGLNILNSDDNLFI